MSFQNPYFRDIPTQKLYEKFTQDGATALAAEDLVKAEACFHSALIELEKLGSSDTDGLVSIGLINLANIYRRTQRHQEAMLLLRRALSEIAQRKGMEHPVFLQALYILADIDVEAENFEEAESCLEQGLLLHERVLGSQHPFLSESIRKLAAFYRHQGDTEKAGQLEERAYGLESASQNWEIYNAEGSDAYFRKEFSRAVTLFQKALWLLSEIPQMARSEEMGRILHNLSSVNRKLGNLESAESYGQKALQIYEGLYDSKNPSLSGPLRNMMEIYRQTGREREAKALLKQLRKLKE